MRGGPRPIPYAIVDGVSHIVEYLANKEVETVTDEVVQQVNDYLVFETRVRQLFRNNFGDNFPEAVRRIHQIMYEDYR